MLQECIDYALIEKLAKERPDATIFLIGRTLPGVDLSHLKQYKISCSTDSCRSPSCRPTSHRWTSV